MPVITTIADLKRLHKRRTPKMFYDYAESGSWTEQTFRENTSDFDQIRLRQRVAVDMTNRTTKTQMIGQDVAMPVALAPVGLTGMQCADGEIKAARAAEKMPMARPTAPRYHAPSSRRMRASPITSGSKLRAFTPARLFALGFTRSQCMTQPQVVQRTNWSERLPQA